MPVESPPSPFDDTMLLFRAGSHACALPVTRVVETMRPLPVRPLTGVPPFVAGVAVIRGQPVPVVDAAALFEPAAHPPPGRFVVLAIGDRKVALAVDEVRGVRRMDSAVLRRVPPLLARARPNAAEALGTLDGDLLVVLGCARLLPDDVWIKAATGASAAS